MADPNNNFSKRKARTSYVSTVVGVTLVLFLLGAFGSLVLNAQKLSVYAKENIVINIFLKDDTKEVDILQMKKGLDLEPFSKQSTYVSKEEAGELMKAELGEDFVEFLGYNPLLPSIDLKLNAAYAVPDSIEWIKENLAANPYTRQVVYNPKVVENIDSNVNAIGLVLLGFSVLLLIISIAMINNTIRLSIYSKRFLIRTMQLVGATEGFIRRPFLSQSMLQGLLAAVLAIGLLAGGIYAMVHYVPESRVLFDLELFAQLFGGIVLLGLFITFVSTYFAVTKYLRMRSADIH